ncbi:MAG: hypothetical protein LPK19_01220 [Hymenobacteraceae bacterium]|nr:hypothetical protein [Hymenobacteraceae bacterium]MDX5394794.1 hypothetical protein [Hymenobacteraceae bacterium]MDX5510825.1 hypothetical protein [Hymenobacteraceae bacterium]
MVLATLHGFHARNPNYTYEDVFKTVENFNPDVVAVEIRPEDLDKDTAYLKNIYPFEMRELLQKLPETKKVGFDWYGEEAAGKMLTREMFMDSTTELGRVKALERALAQDTVMATKFAGLKNLQQQQFDLIKDATPAQVNDGRYDAVSAKYYEAVDSVLAGTKYEYRATFNRQRDKHIGDNIIEIIKQNPGKRIVFVTGADHRGFAEARIKKELGEQVELVPVP